MIDVVAHEYKQEEDSLFYLLLKKGDEEVGVIGVYQHPNDINGAEVHLEIAPKWQRKWLSRSLRDRILDSLFEYSGVYNIRVLYSTALTSVSPRLLEFFRFIEYNKRQPKTYYYLEVA